MSGSTSRDAKVTDPPGFVAFVVWVMEIRETAAPILVKVVRMKSLNNKTLIHTFAALRLATGVAAWAAPTTTGRLLGLNAGRDQPFTAQLFGSRELTLAVAITDSGSPRLRTRALQLGLLTDVLDVVAAVRGIRARTLSPTGAVVAGGGAALFAGLGLAALSGQRGASEG